MANQSKLQNKDDSSYEEHTDPFVSRDDEDDDSEQVSEIIPEKDKGKAVMKEDCRDDSEEVSGIDPVKGRIDYKGKGKAVMEEDFSCLTIDSDTDMLEGSRFEAGEISLGDFSHREIDWASTLLDFKNQVGRPMWKLWDEQFEKWYNQYGSGRKAVSSLSGCKETMDPSPEITIQLRDYQKEWLHWAVKQEESKFKGGILADEIGMGKTVEAISLVVTRRSLDPSDFRSTLVICPEECLTQWESEIVKCTVEDSIRVLVYHGTNETRHSKEFSEYDFVLTTYDTVKDEFGKRQDPLKKDAPNIYSVRSWKRIILDEAHCLNNTSTKTAMYISTLKSEYRWALTGQIDGEGLYAMIHFLQVHPYSFFLCKDCDDQLLFKSSDVYGGTRKCNHGKKKRFCWWKERVSSAIRLHHNRYLGLKAMIMLKHKILKDILLRRKRRKDSTLPPKIVKNTFYGLDSDEQQYYEKVAEANQANTLVHLSELQKIVDHPSLFQEENVVLANIKPSTKLGALCEAIRDMVQENGSAKGVVFSQFPEFLDLIHYSLDQSGITCVQLLANMTKEQKDEAVEDFTKIVEEPKDFKRILLVSIKAGVRPSALDLTSASYVFLMEPCWNPFTELQAHELVHRIGQYQPVRVVRFIIPGTIEEKILAAQEKKLAAIDWLTGDDDGSKFDAAAVKLLFDKRGTL